VFGFSGYTDWWLLMMMMLLETVADRNKQLSPSVFYSLLGWDFVFFALWQTARPEYNQILSKKGQEAGSSLF
jgi:hypothetical protein